MNSKITVSGCEKRPTFNYGSGTDFSNVSVQLLESIRNCIESSQMLQCDVAQSILRQEQILKDIRRAVTKKRKRA